VNGSGKGFQGETQLHSHSTPPPSNRQNNDTSTPNGVGVGAQFGKWTIVRPPVFQRALCKCDCGTVREVSVEALLDGSARSCGCGPAGGASKGSHLPDWRPQR
jgi:hypothetical protein